MKKEEREGWKEGGEEEKGGEKGVKREGGKEGEGKGIRKDEIEERNLERRDNNRV